MKYFETESVELKRNLNETFEKEVVAFLNTHDGVIYIGVEDDGNICGVEKLDETMKKISDIISTGILPNPQELISVSAKYEEGKFIIEIQVKKGDSLYYINKYGRSSKGCYIRVGTSCRSMTEEQINFRYKEFLLSNVDISQIESRRENLTFTQLKIYYSGMKYHINDDTFEKNLNLFTENGKYNLLAELLSDENRISIKIARFKGKNKAVLVEKSEYGYQCLLVAIDRMINRLEAENYTMSIITSSRRIDKRLLDMHSLKEVLINAMVHNDWTSVEPAVYLFEDRIEIISHGGLPYGQTKEMFLKGVSKPRNKGLMRIFTDLEYCEQTGHGIPDVIGVYGEEVFEIYDSCINVVLPFDEEVMKSRNIDNGEKENVPQNGTQSGTQNGTQSSIERLHQNLVNLIRENNKITRKEMASYFGVSLRTMQRIINGCGKIRYVGSSKSGHWEVIE